MDSRTKLILETSIEDFIDTGRAITSNYLFRKYDFGIRSAMIRRELSNLDGAGYLYQIHPSGGRVPTNKGYRFFVRNLKAKNLNKYIPEKEVWQIVEDLALERMEILTEYLAKYLNVLGAVYGLNRNEFYTSGLEDLFSAVEIEDKKELGRIIRDFEMLPKRLSETADEIENWEKPQVYVGRNPITRSSYLSVISEKFSCGEDEFIILTIGSRRMDYRKSLCLYRLLEDKITRL